MKARRLAAILLAALLVTACVPADESDPGDAVDSPANVPNVDDGY